VPNYVTTSILNGLKSIVGGRLSRLNRPKAINLAQMLGPVQITFIAKKKQLITVKGAHIKSKH